VSENVSSGSRVPAAAQTGDREGFRLGFAFWGYPRGVTGVVKDVHENKGVGGASVWAQLWKLLKGKDLAGGVR
jgi:hypothetical protein